MPYRQLPAFMTKLRLRPDVSARALEFTILTAARTGETLGAERGEFDLDRKIWIIPAERMKARLEHRVPLCDRAAAIIDSQRHNHRFIFPGAKSDSPLSNMAMLEMLRGMVGYGFTVHGFRSAFKDWAAETGVRDEVSEAALAHADRDKVRAAYRRTRYLDERRTLMQRWAEFLIGSELHTI